MLNVEQNTQQNVEQNVDGVTTIYPDKLKALRGLHFRCLCICLPMLAFVFALFSLPTFAGDPMASLIRWCLLAEIPVLYLIMSRKIQQQAKPIVSLSSQGITINVVCPRYFSPVGKLVSVWL